MIEFHRIVDQCSLLNLLRTLEAIKVDLSRVMIKPNISNGASAVDSIAHIYHVWKDELHTLVHADITHSATCTSSSKI